LKIELKLNYNYVCKLKLKLSLKLKSHCFLVLAFPDCLEKKPLNGCMKMLYLFIKLGGDIMEMIQY